VIEAVFVPSRRVIDFVRRGVLVLWIGTHSEYDRLNRNDGAGLKAL